MARGLLRPWLFAAPTSPVIHQSETTRMRIPRTPSSARAHKHRTLMLNKFNFNGTMLVECNKTATVCIPIWTGSDCTVTTDSRSQKGSGYLEWHAPNNDRLRCREQRTIETLIRFDDFRLNFYITDIYCGSFLMESTLSSRSDFSTRLHLQYC